MAGNPHKDARQKTVCRSHTDSRGNVVYDDPSCPARGRQPLQEMGSSYENVALTRESAYFDRYIEKAVKHAREAETAGSQGNAAEMFSHTELSLNNAKEAQRAGNVPGLSEGIVALRETLAMPLRPEAHEVATRGRTLRSHCATHADINGNMVYDDPECPARYSLMDATNHVQEARILLSQAAGINPKNTRLPAAANARTLDGQLIRADATSRADGRGHYVLREGNGTETPVWFTPDVLGNMQSGDYVRAQVDADGRVIAIRKI
ncbi:hypothetical protein W02_10750 [Nitrospira sp. KM1]|nr:hypothetical protein W02_10750 [Nitrospira sp. KM1]